MAKNCPICKAKLNHITDQLNYIQCEEHWDCSNCNYCDSYAYGGYHTTVGQKEFFWDWTEDNNRLQRIHSVIERSIKLYAGRHDGSILQTDGELSEG